MATMLLSTNSMADDVTETMEEALSAYNKGDYAQATEDITYVLELIKQKKGKNLKTYLPEALEGWKADEAKSETAGAGMLGGGTTLSRSYHKDESQITIEIITDSPLLQSIGMMIANPMFASGGELKRINREKVMIKYNEKQESGDISLVLDKRFMITVKGKKISKEDLINYAKAIDFKKLKAN